jgi:anti-sigma B factor antagonist
MEIKVHNEDKGKRVVISGEIDMHTSPELRKVLLKCTKDKVSPIVVDLKDVSYLDSSAIATLVEALKAVMTYKGHLVLCNLSKRVQEIFAFAKLDKVFQIVKDDVKSA